MSRVSQPAGERRKQERRKADASVSFWWYESIRREAQGTLVDASAGGFRARHEHPDLVSGQVVGYRQGTVEGSARVVWTRIAGDVVESGFMVLEDA